MSWVEIWILDEKLRLIKRYFLNLGLVDQGFAGLDGSGVNLVNIDLLVLRRQALDYFLDDIFLGIGMVSGENQTCCSSHTSELSVILFTTELTISC